MRIFVIGSTGFIGRNIVERLSERHEIISVVRESSLIKRDDVIKKFTQLGVSIEKIDVLSLEKLTELFNKYSPDAIINAAGLLKGSWSSLKEVHVDLPERIVEAMGRSGLTNSIFIHISSIGASPSSSDPVVEEKDHCAHIDSLRSDYERSKCLGEIRVRERASSYGINYVILRPSIVVGEYNEHREWITLLNLSRRGVKIDINFVFNIIDIEDLVGITEKVIWRRDLYNNYYHVASPKPISIKEVTDILFELLRKKPLVRIGDSFLGLLKILRYFILSDVDRSFAEMLIKKRYIVSIDKLRSKLYHVFREPEETFRKYFMWLISRQLSK
ncbi:MAG: NAD-dependent epimerase/dehydratase family protein [Sulfolobales archaeon]